MPDLITSLQNQYVKEVISLQSRPRARRKERKIVLEGVRLISDAIAQRHKPFYAFYVPENADYDLIAKMQNLGVRLLPASPDVIKAMSDTQQSQGVMAVLPMPRPRLPEQPQRVLILDAVSDPGNLGAIMRTSAAADVEVIVLGPGCVDPYNPKVLRAGMGAHFRVPVVEAQWNEVAGYADPLAVFIAMGDATSSYTAVDWRQPWALVIGNEAHGVSDNVKRLNGQPIAIPLARQTESLNAAVAAGIMLFEAQRQRFA